MRSQPRGLRLRFFVATLFAVGCGTRTGLLLLDDGADSGPATGVRDASIDRRVGVDSEPDLDVGIPGLDTAVPDAPFHTNCPDAGGTYVYVVTEQNDLYSFYPPDLAFTRIGTIACPSPTGSPFSMTVDQKGVAYVVFTDGNVFRVSTKTAACVATGYQPGQLGFTTFGMGYAANTTEPGETLYVAPGQVGVGMTGDGLATIDTTTFKLRFIGPFTPPIAQPELTGSSDGRLYAWGPDRASPNDTGSHLYEIDKTSGKILGGAALKVGSPQDAFAFASWGGLFWIFTSTGGPSNVTRYDAATGVETDVATLPQTIVGAGVSTCAPGQ